MTINLSKYTPPEVRDVIQAAYDAHPEFMDAARRGVLSDAVVRDLAVQTGTTPARIMARWKVGQAGNAETILAMRQSLADQSTNVLAAQKAVQANPTSMDAQAALVQSLTTHAAVQEAVTGVTAEAGRALRQFRQPIEGQQATMSGLQKLAKQYKVTPEELAGAIAKADLTDPMQVGTVARSLIKYRPTDYLSSLWYFGLLSSPLSHVRNVVSNSMTALTGPLEAAGAASMDIARTAVTRAPRERFFGEVPARVVGLNAGLREGVDNALQIFAHGYTTEQAAGQLLGSGAAHEPFTGAAGAIINAPGRALGAEDAFFRSMNKTSSLYALAYRQASQEGLQGAVLADRVAQLRLDPKLLETAGEEAAVRVFQSPSAFATWAQGMPGWIRLPLVPFIRTPINIAKFMIQSSPLGFGSLALDMARGQVSGAGMIEDRLARTAIGSTLMAGLVLKAQDGNLTGAPPQSPAERDAFLREHPAYSIRVGDKWLSYQALQPYSGLFAAAAAINDARTKGMKLEPVAAFTTGAMAVGKSLLDMPWTQGLANFLDAVHDPQQNAGTYLTSLGRTAAWPTALMGWVERATDDMVRAPENFGEGFKANIPGLAQTVAPKVNAFGQDVQRPEEQRGIGALNPFNVAPVKDDPVNLALADLQQHGFAVEPGMVGSSVTIPKLGVQVQTTNEEQRQQQKMSGQLAYGILLPIVTDPRWKSMSPETRAKIVNEVVSKTRDYARKELLPSLIPRGIDAFNEQYATGIKKPAPKP